MAANQSGRIAGHGTEYRNDGCLDIPPQAAEHQAVLDLGFGSFGKTCLEDFTDSFGVFPGKTVEDVQLPDLVRQHSKENLEGLIDCFVHEAPATRGTDREKKLVGVYPIGAIANCIRANQVIVD